MGMLEPLTSQGLGRSPYDHVVPGEGPEDSRGPQQLYDERGRPINPETKRINRDVIRSHNEVMMVIGVAEPENGAADAQVEVARKHHQYEDRIGKRLMLMGGMLETAAIWGVNGMRQRILLYKPYSQTTFYGMFQLAWSQQSPSSYFFGGLPSFLASSFIEQLAVLVARERPLLQYATTYIRLHLAIYTFFQRTRIIPFSRLLPNWRFFIPGTSVSPIPIPPIPTSLCPVGLLKWLGALAVGVAPFAGFYLYTKFYSIITRALRYAIHQFLPKPVNPKQRRQFRDGVPAPPGPEFMPIEVRTEEPVEPVSSSPTTTTDAPLRRQSTISLRGSGSGSGSGNTNTQPTSATTPAPAHDDFASDEEEGEMISATLISFDVEATEPMADPSSSNNASTNNTNNGGDTTPGIWSAELRPNLVDGGSRPAGHAGNQGAEPVYRENALTRLGAVLATDVLAITPARLLMMPFAAMVWLGLARPYMARMGMPLEGVVVRGVGRWWGLSSGRALVNMLGLELLLAVMHGEAWAVVMLVAERFRFGEEEWKEEYGEAKEGEGEEERRAI